MSQNSLLRWWVVGLITAVMHLLTGGCAGRVATIPSEVPQEMQEVRTQLKRGTTRAEVQEVLGSPYFQNDSLRVEAYRKTGTDVDFGMVVFIPLVLPGKKHAIHFFIAYDEAWRVHDSDSDVGRGRTPQLVAADLVLSAASLGERPEVLLATKELSQLAISAPPSPGMCVLIVLSNPVPMKRVLVDGVEVVDFDPTTLESTLFNAFSRHEIGAGEHTIEVDQQSVTSRFRQQLECKPGTFNYMRLEAQLIRKYWSWYGVVQEGQIVITPDPPPDAKELRQILAHEDDWYGFAEGYYAGTIGRRANAANLEPRSGSL